MLSPYIYFLSFALLCWQNKTDSDNRKKVPSSSGQVAELPDVNSIPDPETIDSARLQIKEQLFEAYRSSEKYKEQIADSTHPKRILNVAWTDAGLQKITNAVTGEMISLVVLTQGYQIGDTIRVTIAAEDGQTLIPGADCGSLTFTGINNYIDLAVLQDVFSIEGEEEQVIISPEWQDRYCCQ